MDTTTPLNIHLVAACGTGMGTLACLLKEMGHVVSGSDQNVYPPMSDLLRENGIELFFGFDPKNLDHNPDLVIIGNAVSRDNPEAQAVMEREIPYLSMPQAVNRFVAADKKIILVTGTHGKTTTSSIMAHILATAGLDPSFMIGGILKDYQASFKKGSGEFIVIEGDEYDTAFFDKGPKFMHYDPHVAIMTGVEFDHADIFRDLDHINSVFTAFIQKSVPAGAHIVACRENENLMDLLDAEKVGYESYGDNGDWQVGQIRRHKGRTQALLKGPDCEFEIDTAMVGRHNLLNTLACTATALKIGIPVEKIQEALATFSGVKRRQEIRGVKNQITVMDDFAHHPSAVKETISAVKPFYPDGKVIAVFEPRTNTSMRHFFQEIYPKAFVDADLVCICNPSVKKKIPQAERFLPEKLVQDINALGVDAHHFETVDAVLEFLPTVMAPHDLILIMSNGGFENIHTRLLEKIA